MTRVLIRNLVCLVILLALASGLTWAQKTEKSTDEKANIEAYVDLIRTNLKEQKTQILSTMMGFTPDEAAAFWPIYKSYDAELTKLGDRKLAIIKDYAEHFESLTDDKANELIQKSFQVAADRDALLKKCYEQVKEKLGATNAARFVQIEHQMLLIIDLQMASQLPAVK